MINPSFIELSRVSDSRYGIVSIAAKRARRIVAGSKPLVDTKALNPVSIAIEEIMAGKVEFDINEDRQNFR